MNGLKKWLNLTSYKNLLTGAAAVTVANLVNSIFAYLLLVFLGRKLSLPDYGTFNSLLSLFSLLSVFNSGFATSVIKVVSELLGKEKITALSKLFWMALIWFSSAGIFISLILIFFRESFAEYLNISDHTVFLYFSLYTLFAFILVTPSSYFRGLLLFKEFAIFLVFSGLLRYLMSVLFVNLGYAVNGVYLGISISQILLLLYAFYVVKKRFIYDFSVDLKSYYKRIFMFSIPTFTVFFGMMMFNNIDVILVKRFFDPVTAGLYSGVVTIGKIILFGAGSIVIVMFPQISALKTAGKEYFEKFKLFLYIQLVLVLGGLFAFAIFPQFFTKLLFGNGFVDSVQYLPLYALFISLYVLVNFMAMFYLAIDRVKISYFLISGAILQVILLNIFNQTLKNIILVNTTVMAFMLITMFGYLYKLKKEV